jgi:hypothetical protein
LESVGQGQESAAFFRALTNVTMRYLVSVGPHAIVEVLGGMVMYKIGFIALLLTLPLGACGEDSQPMPEPSVSGDAHFTATISGAYQGQVAGPGAYVLLPEAGFEKQGYFFLADGRGLRPHGITFILPRGMEPRRYSLESVSPFDMGITPSVRVDHDTGTATLSSDRNTQGFLKFRSVPGDNVSGNFDFTTEDIDGKQINVSGRFSFATK